MESRWKDHFVASMAAVHGRHLVRFLVSRLRNPGEAQDLAQEVYLRMLRLDRPDLIRSPEAYLFTIAANIVREHALKQSSQPLHVCLQEVSGEESTTEHSFGLSSILGPEEAALQAARLHELEEVLSGLPPKMRVALIWHRRDGQTYKQIAARLGVSVNMIKKYLVRAVAYCRQRMSEEQGR